MVIEKYKMERKDRLKLPDIEYNQWVNMIIIRVLIFLTIDIE